MRPILPIACLLLLAACSEPPAESPPATPPMTQAEPPLASPQMAGDTNCAASALTLAVTAQDAGAGSRFATLAFNNTGPTACTLQGYPDITFVGADGQPRSPFRIEQTPDQSGAAPAAVTVQPNGQAWFDVVTTAVAGEVPGETEPCAAVTSVRVTLPGDAGQVETSFQGNPCNQRARVSPVRGTAEPAPSQ